MPQLEPSNNKSPQLQQRVPGLRNLEREQHATWIELFFDLVFVVAIAQLSHYLETHLTISGFGQFVLLFIPSWWAWVLFTFYSDRFDTDDSIHRLLMLTGMLTILFLAANVHNAFGDGAAGFTIAYVLARTVVLALYYRASRHVPVALASVKLYLASYIPSSCVWLISIVVPEPLRYGLWAIAIAIELSMPIIGSRILVGTPSHPSHLPERFGLFTLIVLGEAIVSVATATANTDWRLSSIMAAVGGFAIAACLWWLYFNFLENAVIIRDTRSVHIYNYGHLPILMGLTLVAVGIEHTISEVHHNALSAATRWTLCGGLSLYVFAIILVWVLGCHRRVKWLSVSTIAITLGLAIIGGSLPPLVLEGGLVAILVSKVILEILRPYKTAQLVAEDSEIIKSQL